MAPKPNSFQGVSPVILSSSCDVLANNSAIPDSGQMTYPFRKGIWVDEISWSMRMATVGGTATFGAELGALVSTKLAFGQHTLMRDAMPVWLLGTMMDAGLETQADVYLTSPAVAYSMYRWKLPNPLYLEPGQVLGSWFTRGNDGFPSINVQVTYKGRTAAPGTTPPRIIPIPYAAPFVTTLGNTYQQSNENHLFNIFDVPLRVQRLTGRVFGYISADTASIMKNLTPAVAGTDVTVLMNDSWGGKMVNNNTGLSDVFDCLRGAWTVDTLMPPKGVYEARVWNMAVYQQIHIGMIGTREEQL